MSLRSEEDYYLQVTGYKEIPESTKVKVLEFHEMKDFYFFQFTPPKKYIGTIDLTKLIGTAHVSYTGVTWWQMRLNLKRSYVKNKEDAVNWMMEPAQGDKACFYKFGDYFFIESGNHRACVAKNAGVEKVKAQIIEYFFDEELFNLYQWYNNIFKINLDFGKPYEPVYRKQIDEWQITNDIFTFTFFRKEELQEFKKLYESVKVSHLKYKALRIMCRINRYISIHEDKHYFSSSFKEPGAIKRRILEYKFLHKLT